MEMVRFMPQLESEHPYACDNEILRLVFSVTNTRSTSAGAAAVRKGRDVHKIDLKCVRGEKKMVKTSPYPQL